MPRSARTRELYHEAHMLGDAYYSCISARLRARQHPGPDCLEIAHLYRQKLEYLMAHLMTLPASDDTTALIRSTNVYIELVDGDTALFTREVRAAPANGVRSVFNEEPAGADNPEISSEIAGPGPQGTS